MPSLKKHGGHAMEPKGPTGTRFDYLLPQLGDRRAAICPATLAKVVADLNAPRAASVDATPPLATDPQVEVNKRGYS